MSWASIAAVVHPIGNTNPPALGHGRVRSNHKGKHVALRQSGPSCRSIPHYCVPPGVKHLTDSLSEFKSAKHVSYVAITTCRELKEGHFMKHDNMTDIPLGLCGRPHNRR